MLKYWVYSTLSPLSKMKDKRRAAALEARATKLDSAFSSGPSSIEESANVPELGKNEKFLVRPSFHSILPHLILNDSLCRSTALMVF